MTYKKKLQQLHILHPGNKNINDVPNGKLINILTEKYLKRGGSRAGCLPAKERWPCTVDVTETCRFLNRRTAVVRLNRSLENVIRTLSPYMKNARSTVRQRRCVLRKRTYRFNYYCACRRYGRYVSNCFSARV